MRLQSPECINAEMAVVADLNSTFTNFTGTNYGERRYVHLGNSLRSSSPGGKSALVCARVKRKWSNHL